MTDTNQRLKEIRLANQDKYDWTVTSYDVDFLLELCEKQQRALEIAREEILSGMDSLEQDYFENWDEVVRNHKEALTAIDEVLK